MRETRNSSNAVSLCFNVYSHLSKNCYHQDIAVWVAICVNVLGLISNLNLLGCGHCKKMKPEYDEAAEALNKGVDVSFRALFCFVLFFSNTDSHAGYGSASLTAHNNHNNPFSCPECSWLMWLACCVHQPAFSLFLISGLCLYPFLFATLSSVVNKHPQFRGRPHKTAAWWPRQWSHAHHPLGLVLGASPCGCLPRTGGQREKLSYYLKWID